MKISILLGGSCAMPPEAIGAIEILWYNVGLHLAGMGHEVCLIGKGKTNISRNTARFTCKVVEGFVPSRHRLTTLSRAALTCRRMMRLIEPCDILVVNNVWAMIIKRLMIHKSWKRTVVNVQRMPKFLWWQRNRGADAFVCPTSAVADRVRKCIKGFGPSPFIEVIPNPVDRKFFVPNENCFAESPNNPSIVYHGRINKEKGLHLLAEAVHSLANTHPGLRLKLIGAFDEGHGGSGLQYKNVLDKLSGGLIDWVPPIANRERLAEELRGGLVYCYPSIAEKGETFGVAPLEAMSLGLPVVVSALECFSDFVKDGETGLVFDHRSGNPIASLERKLASLLDDDTLRHRIAEKGSLSSKLFSTENVSVQYEKLFVNLLTEKGACS